MSQYTTGEMAKLCGVSVRTVQYYDDRGILVPEALSEGGRRLYSEDDLKKLKIICFLRDLDFSINNIDRLLKEEHPEKVIETLLAEQTAALEGELNDRKEKLRKLEKLERELRSVEQFSVASIGDIIHMMKYRKKLKKVHALMFVVGILMDLIEVGTVILWVKTGIWWPFAVGMPIVIGLGIWISWFYFRAVSYICPECHNVFKPTFKEAFWANHTPRTRRLVCPACGKKSFCVETCRDGKA